MAELLAYVLALFAVVAAALIVLAVALVIRARDARRDAALNPQFGPVNRWGRLDRKPLPEYLDDHFAEDAEQLAQIERLFSPAEPTDDAALRSDIEHVAAIVRFTDREKRRIDHEIAEAERTRLWGRIR